MSAAPEFQIRRTRSSGLATVLKLLQTAGLPTEDLTVASDLQIWMLETNGVLLGVIGLERFGESGLLRSLAVAPGHQHIGLGRQLVAQLEHDAGAEGIEQLVLLTQSAEPFFRQLGYQAIDRHHVPDELRQSEEFRSLCPANAVCMTKSLRPARAGDPRG